MLLDELQPRWHRRERHAVPVAAPRDAVFAALESVTWGEVPLFRVLMSIRSLGRRLAADRPVLAGMLGLGFAELGRSADEVVYGAVGRPWTPRGGLLDLGSDPAATFRAVRQPGWARMAMNFRLAGGRLSTETRVELTDAASRRRFAAYWTVVRPFSGLIRRAWLHAIGRAAERRS